MSYPGMAGLSGKGKNLENPSVKADQILFHETISGLDILVQRQLKKRTDHVITVIRKTVSVRCQNQQQVQQYLFLIQGN